MIVDGAVAAKRSAASGGLCSCRPPVVAVKERAVHCLVPSEGFQCRTRLITLAT